MARLGRADIGTASVNDMQGVWDHPQLAARKRWAEVATPVGTMPALRPVGGEGWTPRLDPVPALGEHTEAVLQEFGLTSTAAA
jgi:itaconate CoA-transferase